MADYLEAPVDWPTILETTALGAAMASRLEGRRLAEHEGFRQIVEAGTPFRNPIWIQPPANARSPDGRMPSGERLSLESVRA